MRATAGRTLGALALAVGPFAAYASPAMADPPDRIEPPIWTFVLAITKE